MAPVELESPHRALNWTLPCVRCVPRAARIAHRRARRAAVRRYATFVSKASDVELWRTIEQHCVAPYERRVRAANAEPAANDVCVAARARAAALGDDVVAAAGGGGASGASER